MIYIVVCDQLFSKVLCFSDSALWATYNLLIFNTVPTTQPLRPASSKVVPAQMGLLCFTLGLVLSAGMIESQSTEMYTPGDCEQMEAVLSDVTNELHAVREQLAELRRQIAAQQRFDHCAPGFTLSPTLKTCYHLSNGKGTWDEAFNMCKVLGAYLVEVNSKEEDDFLRAIVTDATGYWMGAKDNLIEGNWEWKTSMKQATYLNWGPNEPNKNREENCLIYWLDRKFHSAPCIWNHKYICEMKLKQD